MKDDQEMRTHEEACANRGYVYAANERFTLDAFKKDRDEETCDVNETITLSFDVGQRKQKK